MPRPPLSTTAAPLAALAACAATGNPLAGRRMPPGMDADAAGKCGGTCCGMAHYPVRGTDFYAEFDVPGLPEQQDGITYYIYANIFFAASKPQGGMNQFPSQLILGSALDGSSGPPHWKPHFGRHDTWAFGAHYFFEIHNATTNATEGHAAYGELFPTEKGETLWTRYSLDAAWVWHLTMGVKGDPARTSSVDVPEPYMGLLPNEARSWADPTFDHCNWNSCWELYGMRDRAHYPSSGSRYDMRVTQPGGGGGFKWYTGWSEDEQPHCGGAGPTSRIAETHNATQQDVWWDQYWDADPYPLPPTFPPV